MSMHDSLRGAAGPVKATVLASILAAGSAVAQDATTVAADAVGKGGFSAVPTLAEIAEFQLTGLLVVFTVLGGLTIMLYALAWLLKTVAPDQFHCRPKSGPAAKAAAPATPSAAVAAAAPAAAAPPAASSVHPGLADEELLAILAVAATEAIGQPVSIVRFRPMDSMDWVWSVQGRVGQHASLSH